MVTAAGGVAMVNWKIAHGFTRKNTDFFGFIREIRVHPCAKPRDFCGIAKIGLLLMVTAAGGVAMVNWKIAHGLTRKNTDFFGFIREICVHPCIAKIGLLLAVTAAGGVAMVNWKIAHGFTRKNTDFFGFIREIRVHPCIVKIGLLLAVVFILAIPNAAARAEEPELTMHVWVAVENAQRLTWMTSTLGWGEPPYEPPLAILPLAEGFCESIGVGAFPNTNDSGAITARIYMIPYSGDETYYSQSHLPQIQIAFSGFGSGYKESGHLRDASIRLLNYDHVTSQPAHNALLVSVRDGQSQSGNATIVWQSHEYNHGRGVMLDFDDSSSRWDKGNWWLEGTLCIGEYTEIPPPPTPTPQATPTPPPTPIPTCTPAPTPTPRIPNILPDIEPIDGISLFVDNPIIWAFPRAMLERIGVGNFRDAAAITLALVGIARLLSGRRVLRTAHLPKPKPGSGSSPPPPPSGP